MSAAKPGKIGLAKLGWSRMLKNSARRTRFTRSVMAVFLKIEKLNSLKDGPRSELRRRLPKCRVPGAQLVSSEVPSFRGFPQVQGAAKELRSRKLPGRLR